MAGGRPGIQMCIRDRRGAVLADGQGPVGFPGTVGPLGAPGRAGDVHRMDDEMAELLFHTVRKLEGSTDEAFAQLYIAQDSMLDD